MSDVLQATLDLIATIHVINVVMVHVLICGMDAFVSLAILGFYARIDVRQIHMAPTAKPPVSVVTEDSAITSMVRANVLLVLEVNSVKMDVPLDSGAKRHVRKDAR